MAWFQRPAADFVTAPFYNAGWTANGVTALRTVVLAAAIVGLAFDHLIVNLLVVAALYANFVLDVVDGNLARLHDRASYWGKFADGLCDYLYTLFAPLAAGIGVWLAGGSVMAPIAGAGLALVSATTHITRSRLSFFRDWMIQQTGALTVAEQAARAPWLTWERWLAHVSVTVPVVAPLLLLVPGGKVYFLAALVLIQGPSDLIWFLVILAQANAILHRSRRSVRATGP